MRDGKGYTIVLRVRATLNRPEQVGRSIVHSLRTNPHLTELLDIQVEPINVPIPTKEEDCAKS